MQENFGDIDLNNVWVCYVDDDSEDPRADFVTDADRRAVGCDDIFIRQAAALVRA